MNAILSTTIPLPVILDQPAATGRGRRHRIENYSLTPADLDRFNDLLLRLGRRQAPLARDQVATAARQLCDDSQLAVEPPSIRERMGRLEAAALMVDDPDWTSATEAADTARLVIEYARASDGLIPDWVPTVGRLDDAIVLDTAWPRLAGEIQGYLDFCRARELQSAQRGSAPAGFARADWERTRAEAHALATHQRGVREHSYLPQPAAMFRIH